MAKNSQDLLKQVLFTASIDYITIVAGSRIKLPALDGKAIWPKSKPGHLTVQRCSPSDLASLAHVYRGALIDEVEICVDVRPKAKLDQAEHSRLLEEVKNELCAKQLKPNFPNGINSGFRGAYEHHKRRIKPFNRCVPDPAAQLLYGHRNDGAQVKVYLKKTDDGSDLPWTGHCVRIEVRLGVLGLSHHGLTDVEDLIGFSYRKSLMPYFTTVKNSRFSKGRQAKGGAMHKLLLQKLGDMARDYWDKTGVGAFLNGGRLHDEDALFTRDTALNDRIGQALHRLQKSIQLQSCHLMLPKPLELARPSLGSPPGKSVCKPACQLRKSSVRSMA